MLVTKKIVPPVVVNNHFRHQLPPMVIPICWLFFDCIVPYMQKGCVLSYSSHLKVWTPRCIDNVYGSHINIMCCGYVYTHVKTLQFSDVSRNHYFFSTVMIIIILTVCFLGTINCTNYKIGLVQNFKRYNAVFVKLW